MEPFVRHTGIVAVLDRVDVDTDQIIPKQFLKRITRTGYEDALFYDWRYRPDGSPNPDFELNRPEYQGASVLVAGRNFGCGSSREHAAWALHDYGFRAIIAPSFGDIFRTNCYQNGMLPVVLPEATVRELMARVLARPGCKATVDLEQQTITLEDGFTVPFEIDPFRRYCLLHGLDDIGLTLQHEAEIAAYEARRPSWLPSTARASRADSNA
ncbi:MAG TPA: 3-isopropylmalate dehydratase small subunit [Chloroflexota bacterium]|nr:3-isopropylmalate dehydratase small subunit [Chloroflexota bacterium]HZU07916.1 3-isopropylmalate dehydratase small subunit [Chloroflexota bacterium]